MNVPSFRKPKRLADFVTREGSYFFSPGTMSFFDSRVEDYLRRREDGTYLMIVSNQFHGSDGTSDPREYGIVEVEPRWIVSRVDWIEDTRYASFDQARAAAEALR